MPRATKTETPSSPEKAVRLEPRCVPLNTTGSELLVFDFREGRYRVAYYRPRRPKELGSAPSQAVVDEGRRRGFWKATGMKSWCRFAVEQDELADALYAVFLAGTSRHDWQTVETYLRSTAWGSELP